MWLYAGIDEVGYGPMFGPLVVGRSVFAVSEAWRSEAMLPDLWEKLAAGICKGPRDRQGRVAVNDSKKLYHSGGRLQYLERGVLAFLEVMGRSARRLDRLLEELGENSHRELSAQPWYVDQPWAELPVDCQAGEVAIAGNLVRLACQRAGVNVVDMGVAVVFEDRFNQMVNATRSKAAVNFTFAGRHLQAVWRLLHRHSVKEAVVVVDRQSGRLRYRELLELVFAEGPGPRPGTLVVVEENDWVSIYRLSGPGGRWMEVRFEVDADQAHLPVALASMVGKYVRELFMARFNAWFCQRVAGLVPTAGYAADAKRFWRDIQPHIGRLGIDPGSLVRAR